MPIGYDQCKLCHLSALISLTQIKSCFTLVLFVAAFVLTPGEKAFYVRIVGAMGIKSVDGSPRRDAANGREYETHKYESNAAGLK